MDQEDVMLNTIWLKMVNIELVALRSKYDRLDERLLFVEQKVGIAA
ncbi:MAG: hypothetical protein Q7S48_01350 [bacterium]|nr:hypothetical protein [bacterium]